MGIREQAGIGTSGRTPWPRPAPLPAYGHHSGPFLGCRANGRQVTMEAMMAVSLKIQRQGHSPDQPFFEFPWAVLFNSYYQGILGHPLW